MKLNNSVIKSIGVHFCIHFHLILRFGLLDFFCLTSLSLMNKSITPIFMRSFVSVLRVFFVVDGIVTFLS